MPSFEGLMLALLLVLLVGGSLGLWATLRRSPAGTVQQALEQGRFKAALEAARTDARAGRDDLFAAAVAARHLLRLDRAREILARILAGDPADGEAWLEAGLVEAYGGDPGAARRAFAKVESRRSDLLESLNLHRAWLALRTGDRRGARRLFDEVEAPLETKLRSDIGGGDPAFAEWFLQAAALWEAFGEEEKAAWAWREGRAAAPESRLGEIVGSHAEAPPPLQ